MNALHRLASGKPIDWDGTRLVEVQFYILGLAPMPPDYRCVFFWQNNFGNLAKNVAKHYEQLAIIRPSYKADSVLSVWQMSIRNCA